MGKVKIYRNIAKLDNIDMFYFDTKIKMDENGKSAKERNLPRNIGHKAGVDALRDM